MKPNITLVFPKSPFLINDGVFPPLGILYLSAMLKKFGKTVQCLDLGIGHSMTDAESDLIGISFTTPQKHEAVNLLHYYKAMGKKVIAGGPHPTHKPDECLKLGFDHVIRGYGEAQLLLYLKATTSISCCPEEIDDFPFPDRDALPIRDYNYEIEGEKSTVVMTSRGCVFSCSFCARISDGFAMQSFDRTVAEIEHTATFYGYKAFMIFDDVFVAGTQRLEAISHHFSGSGFKFRCFARSNLLHKSTCEMLARMGVVEVGVGVESGSDAILKKSMKGTTRKINSEAVQNLRSNGIGVKTFLIVGLPGESEETIQETISWIEENKPDDLDVSIFQPYPGSKIYDKPQNYGITFDRRDGMGFYKGRPGQYKTSVCTEFLSSAELVYWRDHIEAKYKNQERLK